MILAALKERRTDARANGNPNSIEQGHIQRMMRRELNRPSTLLLVITQHK
jgi:hypothetical protein